MQHPVSQAPLTHPGGGMVQHGQDGSLGRALEHIFHQFKVALCLRVEHDKGIVPIRLRRTDMGQKRTLRFPRIGEYRPGCAQGTPMGENESVNALATKLLAEDGTRLLKAKRLGRAFGAADLTTPTRVARLARPTDQFLRLELFQQAGQISNVGFGNQKLSRRQIQTGHADRVFLGQHGNQRSFPTLGFEQRPRCDNTNNIARNNPFSLVGLLKLFTHRNLVALLDQPGEIRLQAVMRDPAHGDLFVAFSVRAGGQHDV